MVYTSARWANAEHIGVLLICDNGPDFYVDSGSLYDAAIAGEYGQIGDPIVIASTATPDEIRAERNALLSACDWTQLADAPVDDLAWAVYRQALRDIPDQSGFPANVVWPVAPS